MTLRFTCRRTGESEPPCEISPKPIAVTVALAFGVEISASRVTGVFVLAFFSLIIKMSFLLSVGFQPGFLRRFSTGIVIPTVGSRRYKQCPDPTCSKFSHNEQQSKQYLCKSRIHHKQNDLLYPRRQHKDIRLQERLGRHNS